MRGHDEPRDELQAAVDAAAGAVGWAHVVGVLESALRLTGDREQIDLAIDVLRQHAGELPGVAR